MSGRAFSRGVGEWVGSAEVYDAGGRFAGTGRDVRSVQADDRAGRVTVEVTFDGPFSLSGVYTIADHGSHRVYEGPLNVGFAEALGDGLVAAHNYWPDLGLSQRFFLMVLPDGSRQLSLALLSRGERLCWTVVGEYQRRSDPATAAPLPAESAGETSSQRTDFPSRPAQAPLPAESAGETSEDDPTGGRGQPLLLRPGCWSGRLQHLDAALEPSGMVDHIETVVTDPLANGSRSFAIELSGLGFAGDASFTLMADGTEIWTPVGDVVGSAMLSGGRGLSGQFHHTADGLRMWRREVASRDGTMKAVLYLWCRGEQRLGAVYGTLGFDPA